MPIQARTEVSAFRFATVAPDSVRCSGDIRAGVVRMSYALKGMPAININTAPAAPVPPPPKPEPATPPAQDPVRLLIANGWKVTDWVLRADGTNTGQPAGFGLGAPYANGAPPRPAPPANPIFDRLKLSFEFPFFCTCVPNGKCRAAKYRLSVTYDGNQHPVIKVETSDEGDCGKVAALVIDKEIGPPATALDNTGKATYTFATGVTCDCPKAKDGGEDKGGGDEKGGEEDQRGGGKGKRKTKPGKGGKLARSSVAKILDRGDRDDGDGDGGGAGAKEQCPLSIIVEYVFRTVL